MNKDGSGATEDTATLIPKPVIGDGGAIGRHEELSTHDRLRARYPGR